MTMRRPKAPPFKQRLEVATATAKAAGATRLKVNPDGSVELDFRPNDAKSSPPDGEADPNDFDLIIEKRKGKTREEKP